MTQTSTFGHPPKAGQLHHVDGFEDIPAHEVPFLSNDEGIIAAVCQDRSPDDLVFPALPDLDYEELREVYADELFLISYEAFGATGAPNSISGLGKLLKEALDYGATMQSADG